MTLREKVGQLNLVTAGQLVTGPSGSGKTTMLNLVGGIDPSFQFALDWDLLARFTQANLRIVRLPYFLGCFRVHPSQKTSAAIHTTGAEEMVRIRTRFH